MVEFSPPGRPPWVGNFSKDGALGQRLIAPYPGTNEVVVVTGGSAYVVDPATRLARGPLGEFFVDVIATDSPALLVFNWCGLCFEAYDGGELCWRTRRVSWDEIRNIRQVGDCLEADTWDAPTQGWIPVTIDLHTGQATGGAYPLSDSTSREILRGLE